MIDICDIQHTPTIEEISDYIGNPLFAQLCDKLAFAYKANVKIEFSKCSMAYGWNVKFKKSGKTLCTLYPKEQYFTVLVVVSQKEKEQAEALLSQISPALRELYHQTEEGNGQRWLMIDFEDEDDTYEDALKLIELRYETRVKRMITNNRITGKKRNPTYDKEKISP